MYRFLYFRPALLTSILFRFIQGSTVEECPSSAELSADRTPKLMKTPFYPLKYQANMACKWVIRSDHSHEVIKLEVIDSELQGSPTCGEDFGEVKDGEAVWDRVMRKWCGDTVPNVLTTTGPIAQVLFRSNKNENYKGFQLKYWTALKSKIVHAPIHYGIVNYVLFGIFGVIVSVLLISVVCIYLIQKRREHFKAKMAEVAEAAKMAAAHNKAFANGNGSRCSSAARTRICSVASTNQDQAITPV